MAKVINLAGLNKGVVQKQFADELYNIIYDKSVAYDLTVTDVFGALETIKMNVYLDFIESGDE